MFWVYSLKSLRDGRQYVGYTKDVQERLKRHNSGDYRFTKGHRPWSLIYKESVNSRSEAVKLERYYKSGVGRKVLKKNISNSQT